MNIVNNKTDILSIDYRAGALILMDKPLEWSSFSVVNKVRWLLRHHYNIKKIKVGHGGTLDPLATGLLLIFTGKATKQINEYMGMDKSYDCMVKLGAQTLSYDAEQEEILHKDTSFLEEAKILESVESFKGWQEQTAPIFSALKVNGQPMYKLARKGQKDIKPKKRKICIYDVSAKTVELPHISLNLRCSKGTYIRSFAHDLGQKLDVGGYLTELRRTEVGNFNIENALSVDTFEKAFKN